MEKKKVIGIILAAGKGKRMNAPVAKQYLHLLGHPLLYYTIRAMELAKEVDEIILVVEKEMISYCQREIVDRYGFVKVKGIVPGGKERYDSVYQGLCLALRGNQDHIVLIHDGARPFLEESTISRCIQGAITWGACSAGMPVKDTIKVVDKKNKVITTPPRDSLWLVQTPQAFKGSLLWQAYERAKEDWPVAVTDDAMLVEQILSHPVYMVEGSYKNIKVTTPEDMVFGEAILKGEKI